MRLAGDTDVADLARCIRAVALEPDSEEADVGFVIIARALRKFMKG